MNKSSLQIINSLLQHTKYSNTTVIRRLSTLTCTRRRTRIVFSRRSNSARAITSHISTIRRVLNFNKIRTNNQLIRRRRFRTNNRNTYSLRLTLLTMQRINHLNNNRSLRIRSTRRISNLLIRLILLLPRTQNTRSNTTRIMNRQLVRNSRRILLSNRLLRRTSILRNSNSTNARSLVNLLTIRPNSIRPRLTFNKLMRTNRRIRRHNLTNTIKTSRTGRFTLISNRIRIKRNFRAARNSTRVFNFRSKLNYITRHRTSFAILSSS